MRPTILLFDIDGTLITSGGVGRRSIERTFRERYQRDDACNFPFDGMTDRQIARQGITAIGLKPTESAIDEVLDAYLDVLRVEVEKADAKTYRLHVGMVDAIRAARTRGHAIGLGTGNI